jgi:exosortase
MPCGSSSGEIHAVGMPKSDAGGEVLSPAGGTTAVTFVSTHAPTLCLSLLAGLFLFWPTIRDLVHTWATDPNSSHGFLVPVISAAILIADRSRLAATRVEASLAGLSVLLASLLVFALGHMSYTNIFQRLGLWGTLVGSLWFIFGSELLRARPFPFVLLLFAIPPPTIVFVPFSTMLRLLAARLAAGSLQALGLDVVRAGSILTIGEHELEVVDACSGIRSLVSIVLVAALLAYLLRTGVWKGILLMVTAVPITVLVNVLRIVVVALGFAVFDTDLTAGIAHGCLGVGVFLASILLLYSSWRLYRRLFGWREGEAAS